MFAGHWTGAADQIGVFRSPTTPAKWSLDEAGDGDFTAVDAAFFGQQGDHAIVGDWDGSGTSKVGVWRVLGTTLTFALDTNGDGVLDKGDVNTVFGLAGDSVVTGNWNPAL